MKHTLGVALGANLLPVALCGYLETQDLNFSAGRRDIEVWDTHRHGGQRAKSAAGQRAACIIQS